jgi:cellulose synthase/poly-beta-1,6-N-acetylglucosamine synthase-like glycosyltransferase
MRISVIVPTYRRTADLARCLQGLAAQQLPADEILVIVRDSDDQTHSFFSARAPQLGVRLVETTVPGVVAALNAGLTAASGEILAITDDDAVPRSDWLARIHKHFVEDDTLAGVGGLDIVHTPDGILEGNRTTVGQVQWFGRLIGNHHLAVHTQQFVDFLKGVNMAYRKAAVRGLEFDTFLRGKGAQVSNELAFCLALRARGLRLFYDCTVIVDHYPSVRFDIDQREGCEYEALENASFNMYWSLSQYMKLGVRRTLALWWARWIGSEGRPGLLREFLAQFGSNRKRRNIARAARSGRRQAAAFAVTKSVRAND